MAVTTDELSPPVVEPICPHRVERPAMLHRWDDLTFLHWPYDPATVQALLPDGLRVETFGGRAWVGLVPFRMEVTLPGIAPRRWVSWFAETNVRTYVQAPDGTTGVWFLSLDAERLGAVLTGRRAYDLPYYWSHLRVAGAGRFRTYTARRRWPRPAARSQVVVEIGEPLAPEDVAPFEHWLTARWRLYSVAGGRLRGALAEHPPWPLHRATCHHVDDGLVVAAGLPAPAGEPLAHWSPGVAVRVGFPFRL
jgi:uncharacterized protein